MVRTRSNFVLALKMLGIRLGFSRAAIVFGKICNQLSMFLISRVQ